MDEEFLKALVVPVVSVSLAAVIAALRDWRLRRSSAAKLRQMVADATQRLEFLREWMATQQEVFDPGEVAELKKDARKTMVRIRQDVMQAEKSHQAVEQRHHENKGVLGSISFRRMLLVDRVGPSRLRRVVRRAYQVLLALTIFYFVPLMIIDPGLDRGQSRVAGTLYALFGVVLVSSVVLLSLRWVALRPEHDAVGRPTSSPATAAPPLATQGE